jgi:hypothetical protein
VLRIALVIAVTCDVAFADGVYFTQAVGASATDDEPSLGRTMQTRAGFGSRVRFLAFEAWIASDTQLAREGGLRGLLGGDPVAGRSDLAHYGVDLKAIAPLHATSDVIVEGYVRGGASIVTASGALDGQRGHGIGAGWGFQLRGRVRALGFLWGPLFFVKRGPKVTAALFVDHGTELVQLMDRPVRIDHLRMGFGVGTSF